ncbi:isocitrate lyase/PEP mutase family protein [Pseudonocardia kunmingensis]|uniref:2-methylisocitrate lyase-like PEP mutase family enzyme n=1 Tax=Pseudonocardia kunmingensis TaxID=630975 RepID=A0A543DIE4_9PSEU|nr:isocitrate lyase/phosphoenolpyruvate mutase family protein [Pseudonocardia kunmingensis]TQM09102.1 2-methylisocitrate lyase-like PEP mutase family enzyme [Pseudonocardia kunmingensis]
MVSMSERRAKFRELHRSGCFVIPNPWDVGTARYLQHMGFSALATTSGGFAFSRGLPDGAVGRATMLAHIREIVEATDLPVSADFHAGYGSDPDEVADSVRLCVETGVAGLSIEDSTGDPDRPLLDLDNAAERVSAARRAIDETGQDVVLTGRAENFFVGRPDLDDTLARLRAYSAAGADCLYAPGIRTREQITAVVEAVAPKPVNVVVGGGAVTVDEYAALGVRRISVGGTLALAAWEAVHQAVSRLAGDGRFDGFPSARPSVDLNGLFRSLDGRQPSRSRPER